MNPFKQNGPVFSPEQPSHPSLQVELGVEKMVSGGLGLARLNGEAILLPGALPGEKILAALKPAAKGVRRGQVTQVIAPSPLRVKTDCPVADRCGGCDFLHVEPSAALSLKSEAALGDFASSMALPIELIESPIQSRYRSRATLHLGLRMDGQLGVGFYDSKRSLVEFEDCRLIAPELQRLINPLRRWAATLPLESAGVEISLLKGESESGATITFSPSPPARPQGRGHRQVQPKLAASFLKALELLPEMMKENGLSDVGTFARVGGKGGVQAFSRTGPKFLPVAVWPDLDLTLIAGPGEFTQVNPALNKLMVEKILELATPLAPGKVLDLYSGLGNIALPLAKSGFMVTAVEESPAGAESARRNGEGVKGFRVINNRSELAISDLNRQGEKFSIIILDPPRAGGRDLAPLLAAMQPELIIYIACHPAVLTRDIPAFISLGYKAFKLYALNMFPRTSHLESLLVLKRL